MAFCKCLLKVPFHFVNFRIIINKYSTFKMQIQTPIIQINTSYRRSIIVRYEYLCMHKSWCIFINLYSALDQFLVISFCNCKSIPFIRDMRHYNNYFDSAFCHTSQCCDHLIVQYQIRRHNMHIFLCMI